MPEENQWGTLLQQFLQAKGLDPEKKTIFETWEEVVPESLRSRCALKECERGKLIVQVTHPIIKQELIMKQAEILKKMQRDHPDLQIKRVQILNG